MAVAREGWGGLAAKVQQRLRHIQLAITQAQPTQPSYRMLRD